MELLNEKRCKAVSRRTCGGFSLAELLIVMGIIILFIALAIPAVNAITGTRSIANAENNLSALLSRAREEAVGVQEVRGVLFYLDPATDGIAGVLVRAADNQNQNLPGVVFLDAVPSRDFLALPKGIRLQSIFDGYSMNPDNPNPNHYLGFNNQLLNNQDAGYPVKYGGVILFDQSGRVIVRRYGFQLTSINNTPSALADVLHVTAPIGFFNPMSQNQIFPLSQIGFVLFDKKTFLATRDPSGNAYDDGDSGLDRTTPETGQDTTSLFEESWIDQNATPVLVNRYTGTLIRGE